MISKDGSNVSLASVSWGNKVSGHPDGLLAGHCPRDQPVIDRVDRLLWQFLRDEVERVPASGERRDC